MSLKEKLHFIQFCHLKVCCLNDCGGHTCVAKDTNKNKYGKETAKKGRKRNLATDADGDYLVNGMYL